MKLRNLLKRQLVSAKWAVIHLPFTLLYRMAVLFRLPLITQVKLLPPPLTPPVYWTSFDQIKLHGSLNSPPFGRWCHLDNWDENVIHTLPSIFHKIPKSTKKWDIHQTIRKMFLHKKHFRKTPQYKLMVKCINEGIECPPQHCDTLEAVDTYFVKLKKAYKSMKKKGYLTQKQLGNPDPEEIRLHVLRNGKLCLGTGGNHRIRMAEILGIKYLPFLLRGIHKDWVIKLSKEFELPPHKAVDKWLNQIFTKSRPIHADTNHFPSMNQVNQTRILFYIGSLLAGGKERRLLELITFLKKNTKLDMMLVLSINKIHFDRFLELGIPIKVLNHDGEGFSHKLITKFYKLCKKFKPDIIHTWGAKQSFYALPAVIGLNIPMVNSQIASAPPLLSPFTIDTWINRINFRFSKLILANSFAGINAYQPPKNKSKVIYNGISFSRFEGLTDKEAIKAKYKITTPYLVIMSASYSRNKNYDLFLTIAKKTSLLRKDITFIGIGAHDHKNPIYDSLLKNSADCPRIMFPGRIDEVEDLVNASDIGVLFSNSSIHGEGISNSILEYMALGKPVIANDSGGTRELVLHNKTGYLITDQPEDEIVKMVIELIDDKTKNKAFGSLGRKIIEESFSIERMGREFLNSYEQLLNQKLAENKKTPSPPWEDKQLDFYEKRVNNS